MSDKECEEGVQLSATAVATLEDILDEETYIDVARVDFGCRCNSQLLNQALDSEKERQGALNLMSELATQHPKYYLQCMDILLQRPPTAKVFEGMRKSNLLSVHLSVVCRMRLDGDGWCLYGRCLYVPPVLWLERATYDENHATFQKLHVEFLKWLPHLPPLSLCDYLEFVIRLYQMTEEERIYDANHHAHMCFPNVFQLFSIARDVRSFLCHSQIEDLPITIEHLNDFLVEQCCGIATKRPDKMFDLVRCMGEYAGDLARNLMQFFCRDNNEDKAALFEPKHATPFLMQDGILTRVSWKSFLDCFCRDRMCTMKTRDTMIWLLRFHCQAEQDLLDWIDELRDTHKLLNQLNGDKFIVSALFKKIFDQARSEKSPMPKRQKILHDSSRVK